MRAKIHLGLHVAIWFTARAAHDGTDAERNPAPNGSRRKLREFTDNFVTHAGNRSSCVLRVRCISHPHPTTHSGPPTSRRGGVPLFSLPENARETPGEPAKSQRASFSLQSTASPFVPFEEIRRKPPASLPIMKASSKVDAKKSIKDQIRKDIRKQLRKTRKIEKRQAQAAAGSGSNSPTKAGSKPGPTSLPRENQMGLLSSEVMSQQFHSFRLLQSFQYIQQQLAQIQQQKQQQQSEFQQPHFIQRPLSAASGQMLKV